MRPRLGLAVGLTAVLVTAVPAVGDAYTYGTVESEVSAAASGLLADGSRFSLFYGDPRGAASDTRYVNAVNAHRSGGVTVCIERRVAPKRVQADCGRAPLSAAELDVLHLSGGTVHLRAPSENRRGHVVVARLTLRAVTDAQLRPQTFGGPVVSPAVAGVQGAGRVERAREQALVGTVRSTWLGGGAVRPGSRGAIWQAATAAHSVVGDCYDRYCD